MGWIPPRPLPGAILLLPPGAGFTALNVNEMRALHGLKSMALTSAPNALARSNCVNCGAPGEPHQCSYCLTPTHSAPAGERIDCTCLEDETPRFIEPFIPRQPDPERR